MRVRILTKKTIKLKEIDMKYKAVLWDMDGVLVDSEKGYNKADAEMYKSLGLTLTIEDIAMITGSSGTVIGPKIKAKYPHLPQSGKELCDLYNQTIFSSLKSDVHGLIDGVEGWIDRLYSMGVKMAIGSSSTSEMVYYIAERFNLSEKLGAIVTGDDVALGKPHPDIYLTCAKKLGIPPADCLAIEDSTNGLLSAIAAGMDCAAFLGTNIHGLDTSMATHRFESFDEASFAAVFALNS